jgi:16S rRNA (cytosine967-C5)-methyltransferase
MGDGAHGNDIHAGFRHGANPLWSHRVNTAVAIAKTTTAPWVAGFVNGLLRTAVREIPGLDFPAVDKDPITATATAKSFPQWLVRRWIERYGLAATAVLCDALNAIPPITVRTNRLKTSPQDLIKSLASQAGQIRPTHFSPDGISFVNPETSIAEMHAFQSGWFQVQDEAAQLVSRLLDPQPGETVLDACAGFGGKTGHIAQLMKNEGSVFAVDNHAEKLSRLDAELSRLGITIVQKACRNLEEPGLARQLNPFDRILLDAPCSGLGVVRRNPDIKWHASPTNLKKLKAKQLALLNNLSRLVKTSGIIVYAVCSPEPEETDDVVNEFLKINPKFVIDKQFKELPEKMLSLQAADGWYKSFPHHHHMDGFSFIRLKKIQ